MTDLFFIGGEKIEKAATKMIKNHNISKHQGQLLSDGYPYKSKLHKDAWDRMHKSDKADVLWNKIKASFAFSVVAILVIASYFE